MSEYIEHASAHLVTQQERLLAFLRKHQFARAFELRELGVSATAISRAVEAGDVVRIGRGLYQAADAEADLNTNLAEVAKRAPRAIICLVSALALHGLTDQLPRKVWFAIGAKDWGPSIAYPPVRVVRFREPYFSGGVEMHGIGGTQVRIYSVPKSLADAFRNPKLDDRSVAIEALKAALNQRKATPAVLMKAAADYGTARMMRPYLEALTSNGQNTDEFRSVSSPAPPQSYPIGRPRLPDPSRRIRPGELTGRDTTADMIDSTVVRAHHCAVGIKRELSKPRRLADREGASPPGSTQGAMPEASRSVSC